MQLPAQLSRRNKQVHKNTFGHVLVLAGSPQMVGAAALASLAAMRSGSGLVTLGIPKSLNTIAQKKTSNVVMTWPLDETKEGTLAFSAFSKIKKDLPKFQAIAIGCGLTTTPSTAKLVRQIISISPVPLIIDADALNALSGHLDLLKTTKTPKVLTPHPGEMAKLTNLNKTFIENNRNKVARNLAKKLSCVILLKGHHTVVASPDKIYINKTGNAGMATAGSGDVLTGMIAAFVGQGLSAFEAAKYGAYYHGKAGDKAARAKSKISLIATDLIDNIPKVLK